VLEEAHHIAAPDSVPEGVLVELAVGRDATDERQMLA
jgi:hypothetical protein